MRDTAGTAIMLLQAPIIGVLLGTVFVGQEKSIPAWCLGALQELSNKAQGPGATSADVLKKMEITTDHTAAAFFLVISMLAIAEVFKLFIDVEHNTRMTAMLMRPAMPPTPTTSVEPGMTGVPGERQYTNRLDALDDETAEAALLRGH